MRRVLVVGISGAGKSTLAAELSRRLGVPHHEMDALHFTGPGWAVNDSFVRDTARLAAGNGWIFDSLGYPAVRDLLWERADTVVWLDHPRRVIMWRVVRRSLRRTVRRERIFGGNVEGWRGWLRADHPAWWAWSQYGARRAEIARRAADPRFAPLRLVRLRDQDAVTAWLGRSDEARRGAAGGDPPDTP
ncbi:adenylate kinase [Streptomyces sp. NPDC006529]|uniref:adenylate kinase n=1 Tax=Streptomyces sp. NPDC006529 TaxID=3157177 RepID=UPI0033A0945B